MKRRQWLYCLVFSMSFIAKNINEQSLSETLKSSSTLSVLCELHVSSRELFVLNYHNILQVVTHVQIITLTYCEYWNYLCISLNTQYLLIKTDPVEDQSAKHKYLWLNCTLPILKLSFYTHKHTTYCYCHWL